MSFEEFSNWLKKSVVLRDVGEPDVDDLPPTTIERANQLRQFIAILNSNKQKETYYKSLVGRNLEAIQAETKLKGKKFIEHVQSYLPKVYSKSEIYFAINLHKLCLDYNRLMYVSVGTGALKSRFSLVKKALESDRLFWKEPL